MTEFIIFALAIFLAFYFILLRPVIEQQKRRRADMSRLNIGDEVLTTGGFYATVRDIRTQDEGPMELSLEAAPGVMLRATPDAIAAVTKPNEVASNEATESPATREAHPGETGKASAR